MPHQVHQRKFGRESAHRRSMLRNLSLSVLRYEKVRTTEAKAKEVRRFVDQMINLGKDGSLAARRRALAWLPEPEIVDKVFTDLPGRYPDRNSGYVRTASIGRRVGDSAPMVQVELATGIAERGAGEGTEAKPRGRFGLPRRRRKATAGPEAAETKAEASDKKKERTA